MAVVKLMLNPKKSDHEFLLPYSRVKIAKLAPFLRPRATAARAVHAAVCTEEVSLKGSGNALMCMAATQELMLP